jgi:flagellar protein FlaI
MMAGKGIRIGSIPFLSGRFTRKDCEQVLPDNGDTAPESARRAVLTDAEGIGIAEKEIPSVPCHPPAGTILIDAYWLNPPLASAIISENEKSHLLYSVIEPKLTEKDLIVLEETHELLRSILYDSPKRSHASSLDPVLVEKSIQRFDPQISKEKTQILQYYLQRNFQGYGKLDPLLHDDGIEDITCNGPDIPVYVYHRNYGNLPTNLVFSLSELNKFVMKLAQKADKQLSLTTPLVDAALPDGSRVQITYSDVVSSKGSSFTIRKFKSDPMTPVDLIRFGTYDAELMAFIWLCVENRKSMIIVGGTASGKTSTMNALSFFIPATAKVVSLEDTREIQLPHENWLSMVTRETGVTSTKAEVDLFALLKSSLRQRPEYIIVGEVRGREAQTLFQAMNTGHTTYSTLHAGGVEQAINRLTHEPINVPPSMFGALDIMLVQALQYSEGRAVRRCLSLNEIEVHRSDINWKPLFTWDPRNDRFARSAGTVRVLEDIACTRGWTMDEIEHQLQRRRQVLDMLAAGSNTDIETIVQVIDEVRRSG